MTTFAYRGGRLHAESVDLAAIADAVGTPTYVYALGAIEDAFDRFRAAVGPDPLIAYATKANGSLAVVAALARRGAGADVVSVGEMELALHAGVPADRIVFAGVGKTAAEQAAALDAGIHQFNVESEPELTQLDRIARDKGLVAPVALRLNPDVDAKTHAHISTGRKGDKFGIDLDLLPAVARLAGGLANVEVVGIAQHIGSQVVDVEPWRAAFAKFAALVPELRAAGLPIRRIDFGGGLGIAYRGEARPDLGRYAEIAATAARDLGCRPIFEPGRWLVGEAGVLLARVTYVKQGSDRRFLVLDAAMNDLLRPMLYDAWHDIRPLTEPAPDAVELPVDVVGPICESTDRFARDRPMPPVTAGDLVAFMTAGAYGAAMASTYNARPLAAEVVVKGDRWAIARPRRAASDLFADERLPPW